MSGNIQDPPCHGKAKVFIHSHNGGDGKYCNKCLEAAPICATCPVRAECEEWVASEKAIAALCDPDHPTDMFFAAGSYRRF